MKIYQIRKAQHGDVDSIMKIVDDAVSLLKNAQVDQWQNNYPNREVVTEDINQQTMVVAMVENCLVGFCNISFEEDENYQTITGGSWLTDSNYLVIHRLAVAKEYYGLGVSKALLGYADNLAEQFQIPSIRVDTHPNNVPMNRLLMNHGYEKCGTIVLKNVLDADPLRIAYEKTIKN